MAKWVAPDINLGFRSIQKINTAFDRIQDEFENTLSRDGTSPNQMEAALDMNSNRILNLPEPVEDTDPVRLIDLSNLVDGGSIDFVNWSNVLGKPSAFVPAPHTHVATDITNFDEAVEDIIGARLTAGTNITISYDDVTGETTINSTAGSGGVIDWTDVQNKPATFAPAAHNQTASTITDLQEVVEDYIGSSIVAGGGVSVAYNDTTGKTTITATGGGGGGGAPDFVAVFGGVANGVTSNDAAFNAAEASAYKRIYLPEGRYWSTKNANQLTKTYFGPGELFLSSGTGVIPNLKSQTTRVTVIDGGGIDSEYGESSDEYDMCDIIYEYVRPNTRENIELNAYFHVGGSAEFIKFANLSGSSGTNAHLAATASAGATSVTLNSSDHGIAINDKIGVMQNDGGTPEVVTVTNVAGAVITFTPALANTYTVYGTDYFPTYLSGYAASPQVSKGYRTNNSHQLMVLTHSAAGDGYGYCVRTINAYVPKGGQTHFFDTSTVAAFGGDMTFTQNGQYGTPWEHNTLDQGFDVACINVDTYTRDNDTGARGVAWVHNLIKSEGSKPIDAAFVLAGKMRTGLDTTLSDFSSEGERAIQMKLGQRIYFDASATGALGTRARGFWGNVQGDTYITAGNDGTDHLDLWVGGARAFRARNGSINSSMQFNLSNHLACTQQIAINQGQSIRLNGINGDTYLQYDGATVYLVKGGVTVATW